jgi:hypothetical protein
MFYINFFVLFFVSFNAFGMTPAMKIANDARVCVYEAKGDREKLNECSRVYYYNKMEYDRVQKSKSSNIYEYNKEYYGFYDKDKGS